MAMDVELLGVEDLWTAKDAVLVGVAVVLLTGGILALRRAGRRQAVEETVRPAVVADTDLAERPRETAGVRPRRPREAGKIFISYRREDSQGYARALYDLLSERFGAARIFRDIDALQPGEDFIEAIEKAIATSGSVVVLIGNDWLSAKDEEGERRLENPHDYVRIELAAALRSGLFVLPVLVQGASMPRGTDLPDDLQPLARRNALELSDSRWDFDTQRLIEILRSRAT
jgi:TIR domain-containing protein